MRLIRNIIKRDSLVKKLKTEIYYSSYEQGMEKSIRHIIIGIDKEFYYKIVINEIEKKTRIYIVIIHSGKITLKKRLEINIK